MGGRSRISFRFGRKLYFDLGGCNSLEFEERGRFSPTECDYHRGCKHGERDIYFPGSFP
jgi:hypothetical protein